MSPEAGGQLRKDEGRYSGHDIVDSSGNKIGTAGGVFVGDNDGREYVEVKGGLLERALGTGHYLIPMELCTDDDERNIRTSVDGDTVKNSPFADAALDVTPSHAARVREYYGL